MSKRGGTLLQRFRVPLGFLFAAVFLIFARPQTTTLIIGGSLALVGILIRAWASGHIRKNLELAVSGPYAYTRNPLYLGSFLIGLGITVAAGRWELLLLFVLFFAGVYAAVIRGEARSLEERFGERYALWAREVPLFLPRLTPWRGPSAAAAARFTAARWRRNREYEAVLGVLAGFLFLTAKLLIG